jgi:outer membrane protein assembly factor BamB
MRNFILFLSLIALFSCNPTRKKNTSQVEEQKAATRYTIELVWESDTLLRTPESVLIDRELNILYVSNVNLNPWEKDGNGFISKMDMDGTITELKWIEGLHGPKGMGKVGNSLFIADIDALVEADIETGKIINKIELEGNPQLNDITVASDGTVFVSGSGSNTIYKLNNGVLEAVFKGGEEERFNGLFWEEERMLLITSASSQFKEINLESGEVKIIAENMGHGDAIAPVGDGGYLCTSWAGKIFYVSANGETTVLLDTEALKENAADLDYSIENKIMYVPTFFKNQVKAYRLIES